MLRLLRLTGCPTRLRRDRKGVAALEFAVILPVLAIILMGIIDLGRAIEQSLRLEAAARAGAQYAMFAPTDLAGIANAVRGALPGWGDIVVPTPALSCVCPGTGAVACATTSCTTGVEQYVSIAVTRSFDGLLLKNLTTLRGDMTLRIR